MWKHKLNDHEPKAKMPRLESTYHSNHLVFDDVEILMSRFKEDGVESRRHYLSCQRYSLQDVKNRIERDNVLQTTKALYLYPAFKEALLRLITKIEEVKNDRSSPVRVILVHGVPNVGKSALAECLAYYLALVVGDLHLMKLGHSKTRGAKSLSLSISEILCQEALIVDQVYTASLEIQEIKSHIDGKYSIYKSKHDEVPLPLILFTSGHHSPGDTWLNKQNSGWLCYRFIDMRIDDACVNLLRESEGMPTDGTLSNGDLLNVTNMFSPMYSCLSFVHDNPGATQNEIKEYLYPEAKFLRQSLFVHFFWFAYREFLMEDLPKKEDFADDRCKLDPCHLDYLKFLVSQMKGQDHGGRNTLFKAMDVTGSPVYEKDQYTEYRRDSYFYKLLSKSDLHDILTTAFEYHHRHSPQQRVDLILRAFNLFRQADYSPSNYVVDGVFELFVKYQCEIFKHHHKCEVGLTCIGSTVDFRSVRHVVNVATVEELCKVPTQNYRAEKVWCVLNVPGQPAFPGYDLAFMVVVPDVDQHSVIQLELFHVAVDPSRKKREEKLIMTDVLANIKAELVKMKLIKYVDVDKVVVPYFLHPLDYTRSVKLPFRNSDEIISVKAPSFPQVLFKGECQENPRLIKLHE